MSVEVVNNFTSAARGLGVSSVSIEPPGEVDCKSSRIMAGQLNYRCIQDRNISKHARS